MSRASPSCLLFTVLITLASRDFIVVDGCRSPSSIAPTSSLSYFEVQSTSSIAFVLSTPTPTPTCEVYNSCACNNHLQDVLLSTNSRLVAANGSLVEEGFGTCAEFSGVLTPTQLNLCKRDKNYLSCFALGMRRAVYWCGRMFSRNKWNCSHAVRELVFGRMVHTMSVRERAAVVSMISAAVMYDLTVCCREKKLIDCSCNYSLPALVRSFVEGKYRNVYGGCSDRLDIPAKRAMSLMKMDTISNEDCAKADTHNAKVGIKMASVTNLHCRCHGVWMYSCNIKICKHRMKPYSQVAEKMLTKYSGAVKVVSKPDGTLGSANPNADPPTDHDLVFFSPTPNLCDFNCSLNIPGTKDRKCDPPPARGLGSCDLLCCGKGYYAKMTRTPVYNYEFDTTTFTIVKRLVRVDLKKEFFCN